MGHLFREQALAGSTPASPTTLGSPSGDGLSLTRRCRRVRVPCPVPCGPCPKPKGASAVVLSTTGSGFDSSAAYNKRSRTGPVDRLALIKRVAWFDSKREHYARRV